MTIHNEDLPVLPGDERTESIERAVANVEDDIRHGRVSDDVSLLLKEQLDAVGVDLPPDAVDDLAEAIENDVSL